MKRLLFCILSFTAILSLSFHITAYAEQAITQYNIEVYSDDTLSIICSSISKDAVEFNVRSKMQNNSFSIYFDNLALDGQILHKYYEGQDSLVEIKPQESVKIRYYSQINYTSHKYLSLSFTILNAVGGSQSRLVDSFDIGGVVHLERNNSQGDVLYSSDELTVCYNGTSEYGIIFEISNTTSKPIMFVIEPPFTVNGKKYDSEFASSLELPPNTSGECYLDIIYFNPDYSPNDVESYALTGCYYLDGVGKTEFSIDSNNTISKNNPTPTPKPVTTIAPIGTSNSTLDETATPKPHNNEGDSRLSSATIGEQNALKSAQAYLEIMGFSYPGLIEQLEFDGYSHEEAQYAADVCFNQKSSKTGTKITFLEERFSFRNSVHFNDTIKDILVKEPSRYRVYQNAEGVTSYTTEEMEISTISDSSISYIFSTEGLLKGITIHFRDEGISQAQLYSDYEMIHSGLIRKYGEPVSKDAIVENDEFDTYLLYSVGDALSDLFIISDNNYDQWQMEDETGIIIIEHLFQYMKSNGAEPILAHDVSYNFISNDFIQEKAREKEIIQDIVDSDL